MDFRLKKTNELSDSEMGQICELFSSIFESDRSLDMFKKQFLGTPLGYSYHGLMLDGTRIVGSYSAMPYRYLYDGQELLFTLSVDTMIAKEYRGDPWAFIRMVNPTYDAARADNIPFAYCFPNDSIYLIRKKILRWRDIGTLSYYVLPVSMRVKWPALSFLDSILCGGVSIAARQRVSEPALAAQTQPLFVVQKKTDQAFMDYRYSFYHRYSSEGTGYIKVESPCGHFVYRREVFDGVAAAFLVDIYPLTKPHLTYAVSRVLAAEKHRVAAIIYVGHLGFRPNGLFKLPKRREPKKVRMTGKILIEGVVDERIFDLDHWCVNLSNYEAL